MIKGICKNKCLKDVYEANEVNELLNDLEENTRQETIARCDALNNKINAEFNAIAAKLVEHDNEFDKQETANSMRFALVNEKLGRLEEQLDDRLCIIHCAFTKGTGIQRMLTHYPEGWNKSNCVVISVMGALEEIGAWRTGNTQDSEMLENTPMYNYIVSLENEYIHCYIKPLSGAVDENVDVKIVLMKMF